MKIINLEKKYLAENAKNYDLNRYKNSKWVVENLIISDILKKLTLKKNKIHIFDAPCGTGRIVDLITSLPKLKVAYTGLDVSKDMLKEAEKKIKKDNNVYKSQLINSSIFNFNKTTLKNDKIDFLFCVRFINWIDKRKLSELLNKIKSLSPDLILFTCRSKNVLKQNNLKTLFNKILSFLSYKILKNDQVLHDDETITSSLDKGWILDSKINVETRLDGTILNILVYRKKND